MLKFYKRFSTFKVHRTNTLVTLPATEKVFSLAEVAFAFATKLFLFRLQCFPILCVNDFFLFSLPAAGCCGRTSSTFEAGEAITAIVEL